jgi:hypothetical protein
MEHSDHWIMTGWHGEQRDLTKNISFILLVKDPENKTPHNLNAEISEE